jgi:hypothetical protein
MNRKVLFVLLVMLMLVPLPVLATKPITFENGWWDIPFFGPPPDPLFNPPPVPMPSIEPDEVMWRFMVNEPGVVLFGYGIQLAENPGKGVTGTFIGMVNGKEGTCIYHLSSFTRPNGKFSHPSYASINQCTGELEGFHMVGRAYVDDPWFLDPSNMANFQGPMTGSIHFHP